MLQGALEPGGLVLQMRKQAWEAESFGQGAEAAGQGPVLASDQGPFPVETPRLGHGPGGRLACPSQRWVQPLGIGVVGTAFPGLSCHLP